MESLTQEQVKELYEELLDRIDAKYYPMNVAIQPDDMSTIANCFNNVKRKIAKDGGKAVYGWALLPQRHMLEAEKHAIWESPEGNYIDITPRPFDTSMLQFVVDDDFIYHGQVIGNIRLNVTGNTIVDWILVCESIEMLYSYSRRIDDHQVEIPKTIAPLLSELENLVKNFEPFVSAGATTEALCFCGKKTSYGACHGLNIQKTLPDRLKIVLQPLNAFN